MNITKDFATSGNIKPILVYPHPALEKIADEVTIFNDELEILAQDMLTTMYDAPGIGLAAPQIGVSKRILVLDTQYDRDVNESDEVTLTNLNPQIFINPVFTEKKGEIVYQEGCLSLPEVFENISRAETIKLEYFNLKGEKLVLEADGLLSICLQHENDHLDGITFFSYLSNFKKNYYKKALLKEKQRRGQ